jgi:hypothetical protein
MVTCVVLIGSPCCEVMITANAAIAIIAARREARAAIHRPERHR